MGAVDVIITCEPRTLENGGKTTEELLHEFKMKRYDEMGQLVTQQQEYDYVDADTGKIVPFPDYSDEDGISTSSESSEEEERKNKSKKKKKANRQNVYRKDRERNIECTWSG